MEVWHLLVYVVGSFFALWSLIGLLAHRKQTRSQRRLAEKRGKLKPNPIESLSRPHKSKSTAEHAA